MRSLLVASCLLMLAVFSPGTAPAETRVVSGLTFSDELGGFRLISVSGTGSVIDPIVVVEEITGIAPAVLVIRGSQERPREGIVITGRAAINLAVIKIVINGSNRVWAGFELELQEVLKRPSPYGDGLSFDQLGSFKGPLKSDRFAATRQVNEPYDRVRFYNGSVDPGATVRFNFYITDPTPASEFYLLQEPQLLVARERPSSQRLAVTAAR